MSREPARRSFRALPAEAVMALAILAVAFAVSAVTIDERVRRWFDERGALSVRFALSGLFAILVAAGTGLAGDGHATMGTFPWAPIVLLGVPLTIAMLVTAIRAALRGRVRDAAASAPPPLLFSRR